MTKTTKPATAVLVLTTWLAGVQSGWAFDNPQTGRWLNRDPLGESAGPQVYAFAANSSVNGYDPFGLWKREDVWSGGWNSYVGTATAECGDTLSELARLITGRASDWSALGISDQIFVDQKVNIAPLLVILEKDLRENVVGATTSFSANFGAHGAIVPQQPTPSETVNQFFRGAKVGMVDCLDAINFVFAEGLIRTLAAGEFDRLPYRYTYIPNGFWLPTVTKEPPNTRFDMLLGDYTFFANYPVDPHWAIQGENVIKVGPDSYWGFGKVSPTLNYARWLETLRGQYIEVLGTPPAPQPLGFTGMIKFLDTADIGMRVFDLRKRR